MAHVLSELKLSILEKKENNFVQPQVIILLEKVEESEVNAVKFYKETSSFYDKCVSYLDLFAGACQDVHSQLGLHFEAKYCGQVFLFLLLEGIHLRCWQ